MTKNYINHIQLTDTIGLTECNDGYWLYDKSRVDAFVEQFTMEDSEDEQ